jgi:hypothetical protein
VGVHDVGVTPHEGTASTTWNGTTAQQAVRFTTGSHLTGGIILLTVFQKTRMRDEREIDRARLLQYLGS